jgi:hypothetical protein
LGTTPRARTLLGLHDVACAWYGGEPVAADALARIPQRALERLMLVTLCLSERCDFRRIAVIAATGRVSPRFFISGPPPVVWRDDLGEVLSGEPMSALRERIRAGGRPDCGWCVCSRWRNPDHRGVADFLPRGRSNA